MIKERFGGLRTSGLRNIPKASKNVIKNGDRNPAKGAQFQKMRAHQPKTEQTERILVISMVNRNIYFYSQVESSHVRENCSHVTRLILYNLFFCFYYDPGEEKDGKPQNCQFSSHHSSSISVWAADGSPEVSSSEELPCFLQWSVHNGHTPLHWHEDSFTLVCRHYSTITFYYQKYSSLQHFDKFHTCKNTCYLGVIEEILIKSTSRRWIRKLVILLKGNNIQSFPFLIFSQGWQLAGMSTGCAMKSFYTWVF